MFPTRVRYTGISFPSQLGLGVFGGFQPYIATWALVTFGGVVYSSTGAVVSMKYPYIGLLYTTIGCAIGIITLIIFMKRLPPKDKDLWKEVEPSKAD